LTPAVVTDSAKGNGGRTLASLKTLARTEKTFKHGKDFKVGNFVQVSVIPHTSAILTYSE